MAVDIIDRSKLSGLIPEPVTREIIQGAVTESAVLRMARRLPNMTSKTQTLNVLDALPTAYFVNGEATTGAADSKASLKKTTNMAWDKKKIYAEEIAVIVPIPEAVLDDSDYDIWGEVRPRLQEAFGKVIDAAILYGTDKPTSWRDGLVPSATTASAVVTATSDIFKDIMGEGGVIAKVEESGYIPNGVMAAIQMRAKLRGLVDKNGQPIFKTDMQGDTRYALDGMSMKEALAYVQCLPDCEVGADVPVLFGHRDAGDVQIYFLTNQSDARIAFPCTLRVTGSVPEAWDAVTGAIRPLPEFEDDGRRTTLPMVLEPNQSLFVVLRADGAGAAHGDGTANFPTPVRVKTLDGPWTLTFQEGRRGPAEPVVADELKDLRLSDDESVRYFSGSVRYETTFDLRGKEKSGRLYVNTGQVGVMAKVYVNGKYAGGVWTAPYRVDVTDFVRKGKNTLVIDVVNTWVNRLIGDSRLPEDQRGTWTLNNPWRPDSQLQPSGLFNPVVIERMIAR